MKLETPLMIAGAAWSWSQAGHWILQSGPAVVIIAWHLLKIVCKVRHELQEDKKAKQRQLEEPTIWKKPEEPTIL